MRRREGKDKSRVEASSGAQNGEAERDHARFTHPKILAVDLPTAAVREIRAGGFNVREGSFGTPIRLGKSENWLPVPMNGALPNLTESEIVIADLAAPDPHDELPPGAEPVGEVVWQQLLSGVLEPRPLLMANASELFDRVYAHGGVFILFADPPVKPGYVRADRRSIGYGDHLPWTSWSLLGRLPGLLEVERDWGDEITATDKSSPEITAALETRAKFTCTVEPGYGTEDRWLTLATNKYGKSVAGVLLPEKDSGDGLIFVFPRIVDAGKLLRELLEGLLPRLVPKLFPEDERRAWIDEDLYAPTGVTELREQIAVVRRDAESAVEELEAKIKKMRAEAAHLQALLTETGTSLVEAVQQTLSELGFVVRDVDAEEGQKAGRLHEDLQIDSDTPFVLAEVKGINGLPSDEEALEVQRYVLRRIREWKRTDVRGLTIVNHQRSLPPPDRNPHCFQDEQVRNARDQDVGLLTTWDLYRLARGYRENGWQPEHLQPLLTEVAGRVEPVPAHYTKIGSVVNFFEQAGALAIQLDSESELRRGERIALIGPLDYMEQEVTTMQIEDTEVELAPAGAGVGVKTAFSKGQVRAKMAVYKVKI
jgi:hypothetical protein